MYMTQDCWDDLLKFAKDEVFGTYAARSCPEYFPVIDQLRNHPIRAYETALPFDYWFCYKREDRLIELPKPVDIYQPKKKELLVSLGFKVDHDTKILEEKVTSAEEYLSTLMEQKMGSRVIGFNSWVIAEEAIGEAVINLNGLKKLSLTKAGT